MACDLLKIIGASGGRCFGGVISESMIVRGVVIWEGFLSGWMARVAGVLVCNSGGAYILVVSQSGGPLHMTSCRLHAALG